MFSLLLYVWLRYGALDIWKLFIHFVFAFVLIQRAAMRCQIDLDTKTIKFTRIGLFQRATVFEVPLRDIFGVYPYKPRLVSVIKYRSTYRLNSSLDNRDVWALGYNAENSKGKPEKMRIYFKPSAELLDELRDRVPHVVKNTEEEVVIQQAKADKL